MAGENMTEAVGAQVTQSVAQVTNSSQQVMDDILAFLAKYGLAILGSILIVFVGKWVARLLSRLVERMMLKGKVNQTLATFASNIVYFLLILFVVIAALENIGIKTTPFVAILGAAGLAVGLALQGTLANFAAGVMLILFEPFKVGDQVEAAGAVGTVKEIQIFNTVMMTADNKKVIVPNAKITGDKITINLAAKK